MAVHVTNQNFSDLVFHSDKPVLLSFSSPDNELSKKQDIYLNLFSYEHPDVIIGNINTKNEPSLAAMYGISTLPSIKIFKKGKCTATATGLQDKLHLYKLIAK